MKHHPRYPKTKCGLIEVLPGRLERLDAHRGRCAERQKPNEKYNNVDSRIMHRMIHRYSSIAQMNLSYRQEGHKPSKVIFFDQKHCTAQRRLKTEEEGWHQVVHTIVVPVPGDVAQHDLHPPVRDEHQPKLTQCIKPKNESKVKIII